MGVVEHMRPKRNGALLDAHIHTLPVATCVQRNASKHKKGDVKKLPRSDPAHDQHARVEQPMTLLAPRQCNTQRAKQATHPQTAIRAPFTIEQEGAKPAAVHMICQCSQQGLSTTTQTMDTTATTATIIKTRHKDSVNVVVHILTRTGAKGERNTNNNKTKQKLHPHGSRAAPRCTQSRSGTAA